MATFHDSEPFSGASMQHGPSTTIPDTPPNPEFVFPARPASPPSSASLPQSSGRRRPVSAIDLDRKRTPDPPSSDDLQGGPTALPAFSFNPGAALPPNPNDTIMLSPPTSPGSAPARPMPSPSRPARHGHRRGGSEFVGGSIRDGNSIAIVSTSPTKENEFSLQSLQPPPPRRGHRRGLSGAISTNDLPILQPPVFDWSPKGNSAPNSPTNFDQGINATIPLPTEPSTLSPLSDALPLRQNDTEETIHTVMTLPIDQELDEPKPQRSGSKARVGFSDTLEFIPRPLSLVSSDTSSTVTARPMHSVSDSISSLVSPISPMTLDHEAYAPVTRSPAREISTIRPSTAGAVLDVSAPPSGKPNTSPRRRNSIPALVGIPSDAATSPSTPSSTKTPKRWSFFGLDPFVYNNASNKDRPISSSSSDSADGSDYDGAEWPRDKSKKSNRRSKMRNVRGWAGAILPLKSKSDKKRSRPTPVRPPTPPASITAPLDDEDEESGDDAEPQPVQPSTPTISISTPPTPSKPRADEVSYQMIDLDAALGPFNTPLPHNPEWEAAQRAAGNVGKRRLHSAQGMKGFTGPGMHYHRRAESAPDLPPFDPGRAGMSIHRFGSNSTMADVFEEDEDEADGPSSSDSQSLSNDESEATPVAAPEGDVVPELIEAAPRTVRRSSSGLSDPSSVRSLRAERSKASLHESIIIEEPTWNSNNGSQSPSLGPASRDSFDSNASPHKVNRAFDQTILHAGPHSAPGAMTTPLSPYSMSHASSHPSPRSPMSVDAQRISTAPSSVAEDNCFQSLLMGEPGPEVRMSVDYDIPSLTSSTSATTRESSFVPTARPYPSAFRDQRPSSVSSAAFGRRRSSLISLSRLISSAHGERSKLSTELSAENEIDGQSPRKSRKKRLGRMMQFWKPSKDSTPAA